MFSDYEDRMQVLKALSEELYSKGEHDSRFLIPLGTAVNYIQGAWDSFSNEYKETVEHDYVENVVDKMIMVIQQYLNEVPSVPNALDNFQNGCNIVGRNITLYSNRANIQNSTPNMAEDASHSQNHEDYEPQDFVYTTPQTTPTEEELLRSLHQEENDNVQDQPDDLDSNRKDTTSESVQRSPVSPQPQEQEEKEDTENKEENSPKSQKKQSAPPPPKNAKKNPHSRKPTAKHQSKPAPQHSQSQKTQEKPKNLEKYFYHSADMAEQMGRMFHKRKKCVILVQYSDEKEQKTRSYGLLKGLTFDETEKTPDKSTRPNGIPQAFKRIIHHQFYEKYFLTHHFYVTFHETNFIKMPCLENNDFDEIPVSHLNFGSSIGVSFIYRDNGIKVECTVKNPKEEGADSGFWANRSNEVVGMKSGNGEYDNIIKYDVSGGTWCRFELEPKRENRNSPDIKTEILIYLEF